MKETVENTVFEQKKKCNMDCFNCIYDDCINDDFEKEELDLINDDYSSLGKISIKTLQEKASIKGMQTKEKDKSEYFKEYYKIYGDVIRHNQKVSYDKETNTERCRKYRKKNKDKVKDYHKNYYQNNKEKLKKRAAEIYYEKKEVIV